MDSYCVKCKSKTRVSNPIGKYTTNGRPMVQGTCTKCGTTCCKFVKESDIKAGGFLGPLFKFLGFGIQLPGTTRGQGKKKFSGRRN